MNRVRPHLTVDHRGRMSIAVLSAREQQLHTFRKSLLQEDFLIRSETKEELELHRKARVFKDDWPIRLRIRRDGDRLAISYFMFIPWSWIVIFTVLVVLFLPVASRAGVPPLLFLVLALGVIALAIIKRKFDLSPNASWQGRPRRRWQEKIGDLLRESFDTELE